jgi:Domain of unknown function (DUF4388)
MAFQRNVPHAMNGSLADIHAAELVLNIYESGLSGRLRFTQNKIRRDIYFRKGDIIFAHSSLPQERFGEILIRLGKIGAEEFNAVVREVAEGKRLGETLVDRGYISTMDLYVGLRIRRRNQKCSAGNCSACFNCRSCSAWCSKYYEFNSAGSCSW